MTDINTILLAVAIAPLTFLICAGVNMIWLVESIKKKGYYDSKKFRYYRVKKEDVPQFEMGGNPK